MIILAYDPPRLDIFPSENYKNIIVREFTKVGLIQHSPEEYTQKFQFLITGEKDYSDYRKWCKKNKLVVVNQSQFKLWIKE